MSCEASEGEILSWGTRGQMYSAEMLERTGCGAARAPIRLWAVLGRTTLAAGSATTHSSMCLAETRGTYHGFPKCGREQ
jgi:hypothetical protein